MTLLSPGRAFAARCASPSSISSLLFGSPCGCFSEWGLSVLQEAVGDCIPVLLLGNKIDNEKEREVPRGLGEQLAKVRAGFPISMDRVAPKAVGHVSQSLVENLPVGKPPGKEASEQDRRPGIVGAASSYACGTFHGSLRL